MKNLLVTGASGFVGRHLCAEASCRGWTVRRAVRYGSGSGVTAVGDIDASTDWTRALAGVQVVVHLAGRAHVMREDDGAADAYHRVNVDGTEQLAKTAAASGIDRLVFLSSIKVNGEETHGVPFTEETPPAPENPYGQSKWQAEQSLWDVANASKLSAVVVRAPLIYGPHVKGNINRLLRWIRKGVPLPLGSVHNQRSLLGLDNLVDFLLLCASDERARGGLFLAADGEDISTPRLVRELAAGLDTQPRVFPCPVSVLRVGARVIGRGAMLRRLAGDLQVAIGKAQNQLDWFPRVALRDGLHETAKAFAETGQ